jgi:hypothetical protein
LEIGEVEEAGGGSLKMNTTRLASQRMLSTVLIAVLLLACQVLLSACSTDPSEIVEIADEGRSERESPNTCPICEPRNTTSEGGTGDETTQGGTDTAVPLSPTVTVTCGENSIGALVLESPSDIPLSELVGRVEYLEVDPDAEKERLEPFIVLDGGIAQYGHYRIYDADTLEELDFVRPSGLPPQTYILRSTKSGHSYVVELYQGKWSDDGETITGRKCVFGIRIPQPGCILASGLVSLPSGLHQTAPTQRFPSKHPHRHVHSGGMSPLAHTSRADVPPGAQVRRGHPHRRVFPIERPQGGIFPARPVRQCIGEARADTFVVDWAWQT